MSYRRRGMDVRSEPLMLDIAAAADLLAVSESLVGQLITRGHLPYVSLPGSTTKRIPYVELKKWVNSLVMEKAGG